MPTLDVEVRSALRAAGAPIQTFGESAPQRRNRLRIIMSEQKWYNLSALYRACGMEPTVHGSSSLPSGPATQQSSEQYSRGPTELTGLRQHILSVSVAQSQKRLQSHRIDLISFQQLGAEKMQARLTQFSGSHLQPLARRLTVMNVGIERMGGGPAESEGASHPLRVGLTTIAALSVRDGPPMVATGDAAGVVTLWNADTGAPHGSHHLHGVGYGRVNSIAAHALDSSVLFACARNSSSISMLNIRSAESAGLSMERSELSSAEVPHRGTFHRVATDTNGILVAASSNDCLVRVWDARSLTSSPSAGTSPVFMFALDGLVEGRKALDVAFHPDGSLLSVTDAAGRCSTWDMRSGRCIFSTWHVPHTHGVASCVVWSPNGTQFATGGTDHAVRLWDARALASSQQQSLSDSSRLPLLTVVPHFDAVTSLSFVPVHAADGLAGSSTFNGPVLCSTSLDGTVQFHDVMCMGRKLHSVATHFGEGGVRSHCWTTTGGSGARQLVAVTCSRHWTSWSTDVDGTTDMLTHDVVVTRAAAPSCTVVDAPVDRADDNSDDDDEDDIAALRKRPAAAAAPTCEDDDEDDMMALRRR